MLYWHDGVSYIVGDRQVQFDILAHHWDLKPSAFELHVVGNPAIRYRSAFSNRQIRWIIGITLQLRTRVGITVSKEGTFTKEEKPLDYSLL